MSADLAAKGRAILETLMGFDTTSRLSNLALIEWVEEYLAGFGVTGRRVPNADGTKANFYATIGPDVEGGVILSGHSDVVPIDGQDWSSDPWVVTERGGKLHRHDGERRDGVLRQGWGGHSCIRFRWNPLG